MTLSFCTRLWTKGKADPDPLQISKLQGALPAPPQNKSTHPKGKAGPENAPTSRRPGALPAPPYNKSPYPKGKAGPDPLQTSKFQGALPSLPQHKSPHPKEPPGPDHATTSKRQDALPSPPLHKSDCSTGTRFAEATAKLPHALPRPLLRLRHNSSAPEPTRQSRGLLTSASLLWPPDSLCPRHRPRNVGRRAAPWTLAT